MFREFWNTIRSFGVSFGRLALKTLIYGGAIFLMSTGMPFFYGAILGLGGAKLATSIYNRLTMTKEEREQLNVGKKQRLGRANLMRLFGWNRKGLPLGMNVDSVNGRRAVFSAAGIDGLVTGKKRFLSRNGSYSFVMHDDDLAVRIQSEMEHNGLNGSVRKLKDGKGYQVICDDVRWSNYFANMAYPMSTVNATRECVHTRQYVISGATSYEEAKKMFEAKPDRYIAENHVLTLRTVVDGKELSRDVSGEPLSAGSFSGELRADSFVLNINEVSSESSTIKVPYGVTGDNLKGFVMDAMSTGKVEVSKNDGITYENGTPEGLRRFFTPRADGHRVMIRDLENPAVAKEDDLKAFVVFKDDAALERFLNDGVLPGGSMMSVSKEPPAIASRANYVEMSLQDPRVRANLALQETLSADTQLRLSALGYSDETVVYSLIADKVATQGSVSVFTKESIGNEILSDQKINGMRLGELQDRISDGELPGLDVRDVVQWTKDANIIKSVSVEVDMNTSELRIVSVVDSGSGPVTKTEKTTLTDEQLLSVSSRGRLSESMKKDLLMQLHPDFFKCYSDSLGRSVFNDPLGSFLKGEKPVLKSSASLTPKKTLTPTFKPPVRTHKGMKIGF